jgi:hypothetical protein
MHFGPCPGGGTMFVAQDGFPFPAPEGQYVCSGVEVRSSRQDNAIEGSTNVNDQH